MDGVVVVVERGGALHLTRSFSARFDRLHTKSDRMNLAALLFALQSVAADSIHGDSTGSDGDAAITLFATEHIVMARSHCQGLLIALFVRPHLDAVVASSLVRRIAQHYDLHAVASLSNVGRQVAACRKIHALHLTVFCGRFQTRVFRQACEHAVQDEADAWLREYAASLYQDDSKAHPPSAGFVLFHFESPSDFRTAHNGSHVNLEGGRLLFRPQRVPRRCHARQQPSGEEGGSNSTRVASIDLRYNGSTVVSAETVRVDAATSATSKGQTEDKEERRHGLRGSEMFPAIRGNSPASPSRQGRRAIHAATPSAVSARACRRAVTDHHATRGVGITSHYIHVSKASTGRRNMAKLPTAAALFQPSNRRPPAVVDPRRGSSRAH